MSAEAMRARQVAPSSRVWVALSVYAAMVLVFGVVLVAKPLDEAALTAFTDIGQLLAAVLGAVGAAWGARRAWRTDQPRLATSWGLIAVGVGAWAWGEAIWTGYEVVLGEEVPFPSLADLGFLAMPVIAGLGLLLWPVGADGGRRRLVGLLDGALVAAGLLVLSWATSLGATIRAGGDDTTGAVISAAYPLGDVVLVALVVVLLARAPRANRTSMLLLSAGLVSLAVADSAFMYGTSTDSYASGGLLDVGWFAGFLAIGLAGVALGASPASRMRQRDVTSWRRLALTHLPAGLAMLVLFQVLLAGGSLHLVEILSAVVILAAVTARQFVVVAENRDLLAAVRAGEEEARRSGLSDPLTALATRPLFEDRIEQSIRRSGRDGQPRAVLLVDVDDFAAVSDRLGAAAGEDVLVQVATLIRRQLRAGDSVARLGEDQFGVLLEAGHARPDRAAQRIVECLRTEVEVDGRPWPLTASVGLAVDNFRVGSPGPAALLALARQALREAKTGGADRYAAIGVTATPVQPRARTTPAG
jgi:diguanylate cyclase (GGDEF)-like protein